MKPFDWNATKNLLLKTSRGVGFEDIVIAINDGHLLAALAHSNARKYPDQKVYLVETNKYVFSVPFVENDETCFLKTIYPSRKYTKQFLGKEKE